MGAKDLCCEIKVIQAKNIEFKSNGSYFVRCYISTANKKRIQINTKEIVMSSQSILYWNEATCLECLATKNNINNLKEDTLKLELRWRSNSRNPIRRPSKLVGSAEVEWRTVFGCQNMEIEKWVTVVSNKKMSRTSVVDEGSKPPSIQMSMRVRMAAADEKRIKRSSECGCCKCQDAEIFGLVGSFEAAL